MIASTMSPMSLVSVASSRCGPTCLQMPQRRRQDAPREPQPEREQAPLRQVDQQDLGEEAEDGQRQAERDEQARPAVRPAALLGSGSP